ncbi:MMPL family transporter [Nocardia sp. bgisy134]|uniref:MMPL family transporter n=1 Tax=Nocardia sp. bgisy134 TaxID=3413789 RepID=UPI003D729ACD
MRTGLLDRLGALVLRCRHPVAAIWLLTAGILNLAVPQLELAIFEHSYPMVPQDTPVSRALLDMSRQVRLVGDTGTTQDTRSVDALRATVANISRPQGLSADLTEPSATFADESRWCRLAISYDERATQPSDTPSDRGYAATAGHCPANELLPISVYIRSDHDMRSSRDYAGLETLATGISRLPGVASVRSISRSLGAPSRKPRSTGSSAS